MTDRQWRLLESVLGAGGSLGPRPSVVGARRHEVGAARDLLDDLLPRHRRVSAVLTEDSVGWRVLSLPGTVEQPGTNVAAKQALNRKLAEAALGRLRHRRCAACGYVAKTNRAGPRFVCGGCGHTNAGRPPMTRPKPRLRRRKADSTEAPALAA